MTAGLFALVSCNHVKICTCRGRHKVFPMTAMATGKRLKYSIQMNVSLIVIVNSSKFEKFLIFHRHHVPPFENQPKVVQLVSRSMRQTLIEFRISGERRVEHFGRYRRIVMSWPSALHRRDRTMETICSFRPACIAHSRAWSSRHRDHNNLIKCLFAFFWHLVAYRLYGCHRNRLWLHFSFLLPAKWRSTLCVQLTKSFRKSQQRCII